MNQPDPHPTSISFLDELSRDAEGQSWDKLVNLYDPLLRSWLRRYDVQEADIDDLLQDVLMVLMRELPQFQHNQRPGAFRSWLRKIVVNRLRDFWRKRGRLKTGGSDLERRINEFADPQSQLSRIWDREHDQHLTRRLLEQIEPRFTETTRLVFRRLVLDGAKADSVAKEFDLTLTAVFTAKSRVLRELRRVSSGLIDGPG